MTEEDKKKTEKLRKKRRECVDFLAVAGRDIFPKDIERYLSIIDACDMKIKQIHRKYE